MNLTTYYVDPDDLPGPDGSLSRAGTTRRVAEERKTEMPKINRRDRRPRYVVQVHAWDRYERHYTTLPEYVCGHSLEAARRLAASIAASLPPIEVTRYQRAPMYTYARIVRVKPDGSRGDGWREDHDPEIRLVPSVGELGWTP